MKLNMILAVVMVSTVFSGSVVVLSGPVDGMEFVVVSSGSFIMGSPLSETDRFDDETQRLVAVESFEIMTTEVTQGMWEAVIGTTVHDMRSRAEYGHYGLAGVGDDYPMYYVSWNDCQEFVSRLNAMDSRYTYRLPTEAEWEYAARAGTTTAYYWGDSMYGDFCWYEGNSEGTQPVAGRYPNPWGLFDMSGNVAEWCQDVHTDYDNSPTDGSAYTGTGSDRVSRGGSWSSLAEYCRSAFRAGNPGRGYIDLGFRVARSAR